MKLLMFTVFDGAVKAFNTPFFVRSKGEALRSFSATCNDQKTDFYKFSSDYTMFFLGEYDDSAGSFLCPLTPERVISAQECIVDEKDIPFPKRGLPM